MNRQATPDDSSTRWNAALAWTGWLLGPAFLLLAGWMAFTPGLPEMPEYQPAHINPADLTTGPRRTILVDPPTIMINNFEQTCMSCHRLFPARDDPPAQLLQHKHIVLDHGINDRCRNCHDTKDRNRLVLASGKSIPYDEVVQLCAKCHGPTYRDWQRGMHGRTNGYWDAHQGRPRRLTCNECHDPHNPRVPAMDPLRPLPGPHTLRMGVLPSHDLAKPDVEQDPLRQALQRADAARAHGASHDE